MDQRTAGSFFIVRFTGDYIEFPGQWKSYSAERQEFVSFIGVLEIGGL